MIPRKRSALVCLDSDDTRQDRLIIKNVIKTGNVCVREGCGKLGVGAL